MKSWNPITVSLNPDDGIRRTTKYVINYNLILQLVKDITVWDMNIKSKQYIIWNF